MTPTHLLDTELLQKNQLKKKAVIYKAQESKVCLYMLSTAGDSKDLYRVPDLNVGEDTGRQGGATMKTTGSGSWNEWTSM